MSPPYKLSYLWNGLLRHEFERLEGGNILWHIVGPHFLSFLLLTGKYECSLKVEIHEG